ncbi:MAG: c-type cytochrome [Methylococcaceae bacterium]
MSIVKFKFKCTVTSRLLLVIMLTVSYSNPSVAGSQSKRIVNGFISASEGGMLYDDFDNPQIKITIPPDALSADARVSVRVKSYDKPLDDRQTEASPIYTIKLRPVKPRRNNWYWHWYSRWSQYKLQLKKPMKIEIAANPAPVHPELGEIAVRKRGGWQRMQANLYRPSDATVVTLTKRTRGAFRVVYRKLQVKSGEAVERGRHLFFNETWGDEALWGDQFQLHEVLNQVTPLEAVGIGAQLDISKVPQPIVDVMLSDDFAAKTAALSDPAITQTLLKADAVVGIKGIFNDPANPDQLTSVGLTCALCHVTVSQTPFQLAADADPVPLPIGQPILGPPNTKLDAGLLLSLTPLVQSGSERANLDQYTNWGPGQFDPRFLPGNPFDDDVFNPSSIPPLWNFIDLAEQNYTLTWIGILQLRPDNNSLASAPECGIDLPLGANGAWGTVNAVIKNIEIANDLPQEYWDRLADAEANEPGSDTKREDLLDIQAFLQSIASPAPDEFDETKAEAGLALFYGKANCVACHETAEGTGDNGFFTNIVEKPPEGLLSLGIKTPGLRGLTHTAPYFHDGSAATLADVIKRYTSEEIPEVPSDLTEAEQENLMEYLKTL